MSGRDDSLEALREARDRIDLYPTHDEGCPVPEWKPEMMTFPICRCSHAALLARLEAALAATPSTAIEARVCTCESEFQWACGPECTCVHHAARRFAFCMTPETDWQHHRADIRDALSAPATTETPEQKRAKAELADIAHKAGLEW